MMTSLAPPWRLLRSRRTELLDGGDLDPATLRGNLAEMAILNRLPGGAGASIAAIESLAQGARDLTILDVGTGGGDLPVAFARHGRARGRWTVIATEPRAEILDVAASGPAAAETEITLQPADGTRLPFPDGAVDVAHASLVLHHLDPSRAATMLREMARVSRRGIVVNDLQRGLPHLAVTTVAVLALARNRYTRHDGVLSARRAYTLRELDGLLRRAGLRRTWRSATLLPRVTTAARPIERR